MKILKHIGLLLVLLGITAGAIIATLAVCVRKAWGG